MHAFGAAQRLAVKGGELSALVVLHQRTEEGGEFETKGWTLWAFLRKGARVAATRTLESSGDFAVFQSLEIRGEALVLVEDHTEPSCYGGGEEYAVERRAHTVRAKGDTLEVSVKGTPGKSGRCGQ